MIYRVYKVENMVNGKIYIGFTSKTLEKRKLGHIYSTRRKIYFKFTNALRKHGITKFEWTELYNSKDKDDALEKEAFFIKFFNTQNNRFGYNIGSGGNAERLGVKHSAATLEKFKMARLGKPFLAKRKKVIAINLSTQNKIFFDSINEAADKLSIKRRSISNILTGRAKKTRNNYTFIYKGKH